MQMMAHCTPLAASVSVAPGALLLHYHILIGRLLRAHHLRGTALLTVHPHWTCMNSANQQMLNINFICICSTDTDRLTV